METQARKFTHGQDAGKVALALWLFVSPWMLNYSQVSLPVWNGNIVALIVAAFSVAAIFKFAVWEEGINIVVGFWLIASPYALNYTKLLGANLTLPATANHVAVGVAIIILSFWELNVWEWATQRAPKS
jgi:hypothetical protein